MIILKLRKAQKTLLKELFNCGRKIKFPGKNDKIKVQVVEKEESLKSSQGCKIIFVA